MMIETIRFAVAAVLMTAGVISAAISVIGVFRFRFVMNRMHCAAILDTLSMACILGGLVIAAGRWDMIPKLVAVLLILWVGSPIASHLLGRMEFATDDSAEEHVEKREEKEENDNGSH